ncbi:MAG: hypothetical protein D6739_11450 [Nitrospirae bacterium]|nr:MAG: hypothetical protein D6739_11450 [Nitrospirota bacterium]
MDHHLPPELLQPADLHEPLPDVCSRCGKCCYEKRYTPEGRVAYTEVACEYLDPVSRLCTVYPDRFACKQGCRPLTLATLAEGWLPAECVYYVYFSPGPVELRRYLGDAAE